MATLLFFLLFLTDVKLLDRLRIPIIPLGHVLIHYSFEHSVIGFGPVYNSPLRLDIHIYKCHIRRKIYTYNYLNKVVYIFELDFTSNEHVQFKRF